MTKTVQHPALEHWSITFDDAAHTYTDNEGRVYTSVTQFVKSFFPPFDAVAAASRIAARDGRLEMDVVAEWRQKATFAAEYGTRVHAYAEALIMGAPRPHPVSDKDRRAFAIVDHAVSALSAQYEFLGAEQIIFDPLFEIAGMIDLPARNRTSGALAVLDWKTCEDITNDSFGRSALAPIKYLPDSKQAHYMLQLSTYAWLLTDPESSGYPSVGEPVELALIHIPHIGDSPVWRPLPYDPRAVAAMIEHRWKNRSVTPHNTTEDK